jgi:hypothetical protein
LKVTRRTSSWRDGRTSRSQRKKRLVSRLLSVTGRWRTAGHPGIGQR